MENIMTHIDKPLARNLFLAQQVDQSSMLELSKSILEIRENDKYIKGLAALYNFTYDPKPIIIHIDSYGGAVYQCFGLLSIMKSEGTPVNTIVTGCAMSCGFLIAINGAKRSIHKHSTMMYHQVSSGSWGKIADMQDNLNEGLRLQNMIEDLTLENTKITKNKLEKVYKNKKDWFLDAKESLKWGCVDEII
jgi:ATP-dependent Clp protease protease subunit